MLNAIQTLKREIEEAKIYKSGESVENVGECAWEHCPVGTNEMTSKEISPGENS